VCEEPPILVLHDKLKSTPVINPGENCVISDSPADHVLTNYTEFTQCTLEDQDGTIKTFRPITYNTLDGLPDNGLFNYISVAPKDDQVFTLRCIELDENGVETGIPQLAGGSCRINTRPIEFN